MAWPRCNVGLGASSLRCSNSRAMPVGAACTGAFLLLIATLGTADGEPRATRATAPLFWDQYLAADALLERRPDSALTRAERLIEADRESFLGHWLRGAYAARWDSVGAGVTLRLASARAAGAGLRVEAGTILLGRGRVAEGRSAFEGARDEYLSKGRCADAARTMLWNALRSRGADARTLSDVAAAESLARRCGDPATLADVLVSGGEIVGRAGQDMRRVGRMSREAIELLRPLGNGAQLIRAHRHLGRVLMTTGALDSAFAENQTAAALARDLGDARQESRAITALGFVRVAQGVYPEALALMTRGRARRTNSMMNGSLLRTTCRPSLLAVCDDRPSGQSGVGGTAGGSVLITTISGVAGARLMSGR